MATSPKQTSKKTAGPAIPWGVLETFIHETDAHLHQLSRKAAKATDETSLAVYFALSDLDVKWAKAQVKLMKQVDKLKLIDQKAHTATDTARVRAHLARAEAVDAVDAMLERLKRIERSLHAFKVKAERGPRRILTRS